MEGPQLPSAFLVKNLVDNLGRLCNFRLEKPTHTQQECLPDVTSQDSFKRFMPEISDDGNSEIYRFQCTSPGLYQCRVTGLVFNMEGEGDVTYRIVHWDRRLLAQHHKKPAGPLFDIRCQQQSVCKLHLPHCEIRSTGACQFLSVAHVTDEGTDFILPHEITETHVVIKITGFSAYGNVKDEDSPPDPIKVEVLLFYTPPVDPPTFFLHVLLLPGNVVIRNVQYKRRKINGVEMYIKIPPHCKLQPNQEYTLSTSPEDESVLIQPKKAEFDNEIDENYFANFKVTLEQIRRNIHLSLTDSNSSLCVWERRVGLPSAAIRTPQGPRVVGLRPDMSLLSMRSSFISGVSGPVLKDLLDGLLEKRVINDSEREAAHGMQNKADKARFVIDTVRNKGEAARSEMIALLSDIDPLFCGRLGMRSDEDEMMSEKVAASPPSATHTMPASFLPPFQRCGESSTLSRSRIMPSLSETPSTRNRKRTQQKRSQSLPDLMSQKSFERFTPEISDDENSEIYRFQCTSPGLYQCSVTSLVFNMEGEGDVTYRIVHWDRRLLAQHHKKPAGPLFDIRCQQQSVCLLYFPHCEIRSTGACLYLSVAHVTDEGTEFILPQITETHVIINITGFSWFGIVKNINSPPDPIRAVVLLFYTPPVDPDPTSFLHVLVLPGNVVMSDVQYQRRKRNACEIYIETPPDCKLQPNQEYKLSMSPEGESVLIQPKKAEFDDKINDNYFPTFQVVLHQTMKNINLLLRESNSSHCVWESQVSLSSATVRKPLVQSVVGHPAVEMLCAKEEEFTKRVSGPVLKDLLDGLLKKSVINEREKESADVIQNRTDKASHVFDMVRNKGEKATLIMIDLLYKEDPFLSQHLGLI
ncbi:uncharacterized protein LOC115379200 [Myripristis murdjan]|uniref:uncharacterized protein LOC115379200 n=1 Tax=Myripristis murdjan TaxID=586833 RepID=UPI001175DEDF|nr:uncharacterized protein LOC115379200 [Myripristis murdjan]